MKHWKAYAIGFFVAWAVLGICCWALVRGGAGPWIELFNGATWPSMFVPSRENPQPAYDFLFYAILSFRALMNVGILFTAAVFAYLLLSGRLGGFMTKFDSIYRTQNVAVATLVIQLLEDRGVSIPPEAEKAALDAARKFGAGETNRVFKERLVEAGNAPH